MYKFLIAVLAVCLSVLCSSDAASAGGLADGWTDGNGVGAKAKDGVSTQPVVGRTPSSNSDMPVCTYTLQTGEDAASSESFSQTQFGPVKGAEPGAWYREICIDSAGNSTGLIVWLTQRNVDPAELARQALDYSKLPTPQFALNPDVNQLQLVNLPVWLAVQRSSWTPVSASASSGGVAVTTTATPSRVVWNTGDGASVTCDGPGAPYDTSRSSSAQQSDCTHAYTRSSAGSPDGKFALTATVQWHITWTATGVPAGTAAQGDLGVVGRSATAPIRVGEVQTLNQGK